MTNEEIQNRLLTVSYQLHQTRNDINLRAWAAEEGIDEQNAWNNFDLLNEKGLMQSITAGAVGISTSGVLFIEDNGLAPVEMIRQNRQARFKILDALASIREEHGVRAWPSFQEQAACRTRNQ